MTNLLPCPFCDSVAAYACEEDVWHLVRCTNRKCGIQGGIFPTKPMAFRAWNARVPAQQKPEPVAWQHRLRECGGWSGWTLIGKGFHDAIAADKAEGRREDYDLRELYADPRPDLPPLVDRAELIALLDDLASVNLSREACARQARRMADDLIARGLTFPSTSGLAQGQREPAYCGDSRRIQVSMATWDGIIHYLKALHKEGAVDDTKMKFAAYFPLEHCMQLWGIEPYKVQHDGTAVPSTESGGGK